MELLCGVYSTFLLLFLSAHGEFATAKSFLRDDIAFYGAHNIDVVVNLASLGKNTLHENAWRIKGNFAVSV